MTKLAIVVDGVVENVTNVSDDWSGADGEWQPPDGSEAVFSDVAAIGDTYDGEQFIKPEEPPPEPLTKAELDAYARRLARDKRRAVMGASDGVGDDVLQSEFLSLQGRAAAMLRRESAGRGKPDAASRARKMRLIGWRRRPGRLLRLMRRWKRYAARLRMAPTPPSPTSIPRASGQRD